MMAGQETEIARRLKKILGEFLPVLGTLETGGTITSTLLLFLHMVAKGSTVHNWQSLHNYVIF